MSDKGMHCLFIHPEIRTQEPPQHPPYGMLQLVAITDELGYKVGLIDNNCFRLPIDALRQEMKGNIQPKSYRFGALDVQVNPNGTFQVNIKKFTDAVRALHDNSRIKGVVKKLEEIEVGDDSFIEGFVNQLVDESERIAIHEVEWDIIAIGGLSTQYKFIHEIAKVAREEFPSAVIVAGGGFLSSMPFDIMKWSPEFDIGCIGESYSTWHDVLQEMSEGRNWSKVKGLIYREGKKLKLSRMRPLIAEEDLDDEIPWPAYEFSPVETYLKYSAMMYSPESSGMMPMNIGEGLRRLDVAASYGCSWSCKFCFHPSCQTKIYGKQLQGKAFRQHSPKYVVNLMDHLRRQYGVNFVSFIDENFTTNKVWFYDFCAELEEQDLASLIHWGVVGHSRTVDREMLAKGHDVGLSYISYGGESGSQKILDSIGKGQTPAQMASAIEATQATQVNPIMSFIVGFPEENIDDVIATCQFFIDNQIHCDPFILQPYPGSAYFDEFKDKIIEQHMTPEEKLFVNNPTMPNYCDLIASQTPVGLPLDLPALKNLEKLSPTIIENIRSDALKRWVLSLDDATKMSCNISKFNDIELAGLKYMLSHWDNERLKQFKKKLEGTPK